MVDIERSSIDEGVSPHGYLTLFNDPGELKKGFLLSLSFIILIFAGLYLKFTLSIQRALTSDDVFHGMVAREFWTSGDFLLRDFFFFAADPDLFTGAPIHIVTQVISGFSPDSLRVTSFFIFVAIIIVFSIMVTRITGSYYPGLLFASLAAVGTPASSFDCIVPKSHIVTILAISIFLYFIFIKNWVQGKYLYVSMIFLALIIISDSLALIWITIPFMMIYVLVPKNNHIISKSLITACVLVSGFFFVVKNFIPTWFIFLLRPPAGVVNGWNSHIDGIAQSFVSLIVPVVTIPPGIGIIILIIPVFLFSVFFIQFRKKWNADTNVLVADTLPESNMIWYSGFCIIFSLLAVSLLAFETALRYLSIIPMLGYCCVAIWYATIRDYKMIISCFLIIFMIICLVTTSQAINELPTPNSDEQRLIGFISEHNLSPAYADYWDAGVITYLSGEKVIIRPIKFENGVVRPWLFVSSKRWFYKNFSENIPFVLITRNHSGFNGNLTGIPSNYLADESYNLDPYTISVYHNPKTILFGEGEYTQVNAIYRMMNKLGMN